jgi:ABC-type iron transport system FetAB ATPase subunit
VAAAATLRPLQGRAAYDLGYRSPILEDIAHGAIAGDLVVLTGPRRVGKSVVLLEAAATSAAALISIPARSSTSRATAWRAGTSDERSPLAVI